MEQAPLFERTIELLENCELSLAEIANMSGLGFEWLRKLKADKIKDPSVNKIQELHDFLVNQCDA